MSAFTSAHGTLRHFAALQNLAAIGAAQYETPNLGVHQTGSSSIPTLPLFLTFAMRR
jgi:hypothetical protein